MAILFGSTRSFRSNEVPVNSPNLITAEGQCLVEDLSTGTLAAKYSAGSASEKFLGLSVAMQLTPLALPRVEELVVGSGATITLANTPSGTIAVYNVTDSAAYTLDAGGGLTNTEYSISGTVVTVHADRVGDTIRVTYRYAPTYQQILDFQGDIIPGGSASFALGSIGVIEHGEVFTTEFNPAANWAAVIADPVANPVTCGANGLLTLGGSGVVVPNAIVTAVPSVSSPYLGIRF